MTEARPARVLVVDDERSMRELLAIMLRQSGYEVVLADGGEAAVTMLKTETFDLVITDLRMRHVDGLAVLRAVKEHGVQTVVLVVTAYASPETAVEAMKLGAYDYVTKPFKVDEIRLTISNALEHRRLQEENRALKRQIRLQRGFENFVGKSRKMLDVFETIRKTAESLSNVMVTGESGTGKELVAQAIHRESGRRDGPFVSVNCGAIPEGLMESELFGHVKGAFTGAVANTSGLFSAADGGTLFLDEITEIPASVQVKLLRAIQEREIRRVGDTRDIKVDVRLIAASNRDLSHAVADGKLREDLFYRLNVIPIHLPPLRDRREDIPLLVLHFIQKIAPQVGKDVRGVTPEALAILETYQWPGNIRELENVIERAIVLGNSEMVGIDGLPPHLRQDQNPDDVAVELPEAGIDLEAAMDRVEYRYIELALARTSGVQTRAAELLGLSFRQFRYKLQKHGGKGGMRARDASDIGE
jgi:two-component system response regulator PilR (NtrC family)